MNLVVAYVKKATASNNSKCFTDFVIHLFQLFNMELSKQCTHYTYDSSSVSITTSSWNPFGVVWHNYAYYNGNFGMSDAIFFTYNFPFWLFFVAIAVNLYFMAKLAMDKTPYSRNFD